MNQRNLIVLKGARLRLGHLVLSLAKLYIHVKLQCVFDFHYQDITSAFDTLDTSYICTVDAVGFDLHTCTMMVQLVLV